MASRALVVIAALCALGIGASPARAQDGPSTEATESATPIVAPQDGESAASAIQRAVVERHARMRALRERYGAQHRDFLAERAALASAIDSLRSELARGARIERARVRSWVRIQLADVDARLAELSVRCTSGHVDVRGATARRAALAEALAAIERSGRFLPSIEEEVAATAPRR
jgi:hypothetical protein